MELNDLEENKSIKERTTIKVGGKARYYYKAKNVNDLVEVVKFARNQNLEHIIIGGGSNLIFSDKGYQGLVIENRSSNIEIQDNTLISDSGVFSEKLVRTAGEFGRSGLEFLSGIPATVGGMTINNAGAYGREIKDVLKSVLVLDNDENHSQNIYNVKDLGYYYRGSKYRGTSMGSSFPVILRCFLKVGDSGSGYVFRKIDDYKKIRQKKTPPGFSAGCIFKNPSSDKFGNLSEDWQEIVKDGRISAGLLLDQAGAKGMSVGHAYVPEQHANYIINKRRAKAADIRKLSQQMRDLVKQKFGITLDYEVEFIGDFDDDQQKS
jgi:UDP-N-acetylmuramate dehydrogenase